LEATSFSPTGLDAAGGTLVPLLFLGLGAMLCKGIASFLSFIQSNGVAKMCGSFFEQYLGLSRSKDPGPFTYCLKGLGLVHHS